jgi:hypothetical protein
MAAELGPSNSARLYTHFFGQVAVCLSVHSPREMLLEGASLGKPPQNWISITARI